jgi:hypothetical protein
MFFNSLIASSVLFFGFVTTFTAKSVANIVFFEDLICGNFVFSAVLNNKMYYLIC